MHEIVNILILKRNLRLNDNRIIQTASEYNQPLLLLYVFDDRDNLNARQKQFVTQLLLDINKNLKPYNSSILVKWGDTLEVFKELSCTFSIRNVFIGWAYQKDQVVLHEKIKKLCLDNHIVFHQVMDHLIFAPGEILKSDGTPYTVFTPFKNKWLQRYSQYTSLSLTKVPANFYQYEFEWEASNEFINGQEKLNIKAFKSEKLSMYEQTRDFPAIEGGSYLGPHLRFGSASIRDIVTLAHAESSVFLSELIWREFFMHIMYFFPQSRYKCFKGKYEFVKWRNNEEEFDQWCQGKTGIPIVDAGMRELNETGYMHNRVRMIAASFLCKHLLIDWRWGEAYFASKLLDYEVSSNVGNWQWVAGTGCDAAPYFRIFNPLTQQKKFDSDLVYVRKWVKDLDLPEYNIPVVDLKTARERAIKAYKME